MTSLARQRDQAAALVAGHGRIVAEFCDVGYSRMLAWARRPQAAALVAALADPDRGWDAIVIGEYERAFYGGQYSSMAPLFEHYGIQLWTPEVGGRIDFAAEDHEETMLALGFSVQAGDRPDQDPGPHRDGRPKPVSRAATSAAGRRTGTGWLMPGRTRTRSMPPGAGGRTGWSRTRPTAPVVKWMFAQRLAGHCVARITRALNDAGIPCPSAADPERNPHRTGTGVDAEHGGGDPGQPAVHRPSGVEPAAHRPRPGRPGQHRAGPPAGAAVEPPRWAGSSPPARRTRRSSARPTTSPPRTRARRAARPARPPAGTCWPGCCAAARAGGGWNPPGPTAGPPTGAGTATPAPPAPIPAGRRTCMSAKTRSCPAWRPWRSCRPVMPGPGRQEARKRPGHAPARPQT